MWNLRATIFVLTVVEVVLDPLAMVADVPEGVVPR
jgi:hypothetical protein